MNSKLIGAIFAAGIIFVSSFAANAADLPRPTYKGPVYTAPGGFSWSGFYLGLNAGYGFGKSSWTNPATSVTTGDFDVKGPVAGLTGGYNFQTGSWVWGLEGDIDYSGIKGSTTVACPTTCTTKNSWLGTARGRFGYAGWGNWLPYITGGASFGNVKMDIGGGTGESKTKVGWTAGAGVEYALFGSWSVKGEYLYVDLGKSTCGAAACVADLDVKFKTHLVRAGVNYRF